MTQTEADALKNGWPAPEEDVHADESAGYFLTFRMGDRHLALPLDKVERVIRMAALIPLPDAPSWVAGVLNFHGTILPVIDLRKRLGLPEQKVTLDHRILVIRTRHRKLGVMADAANEVIFVSEDQRALPEGSLRESPLLHSVIRQADQVYLVLEADEMDSGEKIPLEDDHMDLT
jgi:purine-binding chemotaxis protein CheW